TRINDRYPASFTARCKIGSLLTSPAIDYQLYRLSWRPPTQPNCHRLPNKGLKLTKTSLRSAFAA
ncbi:MAG TPA: hypothetical protein VNW92_19570, partial [Polyangiaceae bacterium]|nr:hypothetical protein [Polyangiaceae bacterium]